MVAEGGGADTRLQIVGAMLLIGGWRGWSEPAGLSILTISDTLLH